MKKVHGYRGALIVLCALLALPALAQTVNVISSDTTVVLSLTGNGTTILNATSVTYSIADDAVLTIQPGTANNRGYNVGSGNGGVLFLRPDTVGGTGSTVFQNFNFAPASGAQGAAIFIRASGTVIAENISFLNNRTSTLTNAVGGAIASQQGGTAILTNAYFSGNSAEYGGGAISASLGGMTTITNGVFIDNFSFGANDAAMGGAIANSGTGTNTVPAGLPSNLKIYGGLFARNHSSSNGGALANTSLGQAYLKNVTFTGNWAMKNGGAIYQTHTPSLTTLEYTDESGTNAYFHTGNIAGGLASNGGMTAPAPSAKAGGFYFSGTAGTGIAATGGTLNVIVGAGVSVTIGSAATTLSGADSIASDHADTSITKSGAGDLTLHSDNAYWQGSLSISQGRVFLGSENARLGGAITVASGATFGGSGTIMTLSMTDTPLDASLTAAAGSIIQIGADNALSAQTLAVNGLVSFQDGVTLASDLFVGNKSDLLSAATGTLNWAGTGTINLGSLATGSFVLAQWDSSDLSGAGSLSLLADGTALDASRGTMNLSVNTVAKQLVVTATIVSLSGTWNSSDGGIWRAGAAGWKTPVADTHFQNGDNVSFITGGAINVVGGVIASEMNVSAADSITFTGAGAITTDGSSVQPGSTGVTSASGALIKTGAGTLTFANTGANTFKAGVQLKGGAIAFASAGQLMLDGASVTFANTATLAALAGATGTIRGDLILDAVTTAATYAAGDSSSITLDGALGGAAGAFTKTGLGALTLLGNSSSFAGATRVSAGSLLLGPAASLGGNITVDSGGTIGGSGTLAGVTTIAGGGVLQVGHSAIPGAFNLYVSNLQLDAGAMLGFQILSSASNSHLNAGTLAFASAGVTGSDVIISLSNILNGSYNLATFATYDAAALQDFSSAQVRLNDRELTSREAAGVTVSGDGGTLSITVAMGNQRIFWTGVTGTGWATGDNWRNTTTDLPFANGDTIVFDGSDTAGQRDIFIEGSQVTVSGMEVIGSGAYRFTGGAIVADATSTDSLAGTGMLLVNTTGTVAFANSGTNVFTQGINFVKGTMVVDSDGALGTSTLHVTGTGTLSFAGVTEGASVRRTFAPIDIGNNGILIMDTPVSASTLGNITSTGNGSLVKRGAGTLTVAMVDISTLTIEQGAVGFQNSIPLIVRDAINIRSEGTLLALLGGSMQTPVFVNQGTIAIGRGGNSTYAIQNMTIAGSYVGDGGKIVIGSTVATIGTELALRTDQLIITGTLSGLIHVEVSGAKPQKVTDWSWEPIVVTGTIAPDATIDSRSMMWDMASPYVYGLAINPDNTITYNKIVAPELPPVIAVDVASLLIGKASLDSLASRLAVMRLDDNANGLNLWVSGLYRNDKLATIAYDGARSKTTGAQVGADWAASANGRRLTFGLFYDYARNDMDCPQAIGMTNATTKADGYGIYAGYKTGQFYMDAIARMASEDYDMTTPAGTFGTSGDSWAASLGMGYVVSGRANWDIEPQLRLAWQSHTMDNVTDPRGRVYDISNASSCEALAAVRVSQRYEWLKGLYLIPYARAGVTYEFKGRTKVSVAGAPDNVNEPREQPFENDLSDIGSVLEAGVVVQLGKGVYAAASGAWYKTRKLESYSLDATIGLRW